MINDLKKILEAVRPEGTIRMKINKRQMDKFSDTLKDMYAKTGSAYISDHQGYRIINGTEKGLNTLIKLIAAHSELSKLATVERFYGWGTRP